MAPDRAVKVEAQHNNGIWPEDIQEGDHEGRAAEQERCCSVATGVSLLAPARRETTTMAEDLLYPLALKRHRLKHTRKRAETALRSPSGKSQELIGLLEQAVLPRLYKPASSDALRDVHQAPGGAQCVELVLRQHRPRKYNRGHRHCSSQGKPAVYCKSFLITEAAYMFRISKSGYT